MAMPEAKDGSARAQLSPPPHHPFPTAATSSSLYTQVIVGKQTTRVNRLDLSLTHVHTDEIAESQ